MCKNLCKQIDKEYFILSKLVLQPSQLTFLKSAKGQKMRETNSNKLTGY